jgi:hypothetical protein
MLRNRRSSDETFEKPEYEDLSRHNRSAFSQTPAVAPVAAVNARDKRFVEAEATDDGYDEDER